jgi:SnoaL-like domain
MTPKQIVEKYHEAIGKGDFETLRSLLADNLDFEGPIAKHNKPEGLINDLKGLSQIVEGMEHMKLFVDGNDVCFIYKLKSKVADAPVAEWFHIANGKIDFIRVVFDARPYAALHTSK